MGANSPDAEVFEAIRREHDQLREKLKQINHVISDATATGEEVAQLLIGFHDQLKEHFSNEEQEGFFEEITAQAPRLTPAADGLCDEHREMLVSASELAQFASKQANSKAGWDELNSKFQGFSKQLMHHESEENLLLQQAYQEDIGSHD